MNGMTRRERQITDREQIVDILNRCLVVHVGLAQKPLFRRYPDQRASPPLRSRGSSCDRS